MSTDSNRQTRKTHAAIVTAITATLLALVCSVDYAAAMPAPAAEHTTNAQANTPRAKKAVEWKCGNQLARTIYNAGFRGESHRVAWAIAMRESNGNPRVISPSSDYGLFQINAPSWSDEPWWDYNSMLDPDYNARIAYKMSRGGKNWAMWGLDRYGNLDATYYQSWGPDLWDAWITGPFNKYYAQYPCKMVPPKKKG